LEIGPVLELARIKDLRVLVVGDAIMDEYRYVTAIGKAIKENALSLKFERSEEFRGGVWAAASHTRSFCPATDVMTGANVMWNVRYVDSIYLRKLSGGSPGARQRGGGQGLRHRRLRPRDRDRLRAWAHDEGSDRSTFTKEARFLAVNAQTNSSNFGFNMITKYPRADFMVIDEMEARLAAHDKDSPIEDVILALGYRTSS
jgi:hypothetical protein